MKLLRPLPLIVLTGIAGALAGILAAHMLAQKSVALQGGTWLPEPRALAAFQLSDVDGVPFGNQALRGHPSLVYFGFSSCPDVCPTALAALAEVQRRAPLAGLQVLFVTVDPDRDTPAVLRHYLDGFGGRFIGLRASGNSLAPFMKDLAASAELRALPGGAHAVDHTATLYLLDRRGRLAAVFSPPLAPAVLEADLRALGRAAVL